MHLHFTAHSTKTCSCALVMMLIKQSLNNPGTSPTIQDAPSKLYDISYIHSCHCNLSGCKLWLHATAIAGLSSVAGTDQSYSHVGGRAVPDVRMIVEAAKLPALQHCSMLCPLMQAARKPPTNASPAPFVSTISAAGTGGTS
jgi:hypothetical protein